MEELGYELFDSDLWEGWLIFEESSAERIIRDYFLRWFAPKIFGRIKTISAGSVDQVEPKFESFNNLFLFLHLAKIYHNKAWVLIDGGDHEKEIIDKFHEKYKTWNQDQFLQFEQHDFEYYYPENFRNKVSKVLNITSKKTKRDAKKNLLDEVLAWINEDDERAREAFQISAIEIIDILENIEKYFV